VTIIATTASVTAPWWGVPIIAGAFTVVGALIGQGSSYWLERRREHQRHRRRWDTELRDLSIQILEASDRLAGMDLTREKITIDTPRQVIDLIKELLRAVAQLELMAPKIVSEAGRSLLAQALKSAGDRSSEQAQVFRTTREAFLKQARLILRVASADRQQAVLGA
jgi:hypothetical protein